MKKSPHSLRYSYLFLSLLSSWAAFAQTPTLRANLLKRSSPLICGHRGGYYDAFPENSLAAFRYVIQQAKGRAIMLELDIRTSKDGILYVLHDKTLDRTTNGTGDIAEQTAASLNRLWLKTTQGTMSKERIPRFEAILKWLKQQPDVLLMVDVKGAPWLSVVQAIEQAGVREQCLILTFRPADTQRVYEADPQANISALITNVSEWEALLRTGISTERLCAYVRADTPKSLLLQLRQKQIPLLCDVSENNKQHPSPFDGSFYKTFVKETLLDLLVTDYPVEVAALFEQ